MDRRAQLRGSDRRFIEAQGYNPKGLWALTMLMVHEYCHDAPDYGTMVHGAEFFNLFHDVLHDATFMGNIHSLIHRLCKKANISQSEGANEIPESLACDGAGSSN